MTKQWTKEDFERTCTNKDCHCHQEEKSDFNPYPEHCCIDCMGDEYYEDSFQKNRDLPKEKTN